MLTYGSVCSGIEAASVAWHPLGMRPLWFSEIERFPSAVLAHRWPEVPNHGDFTALLDNPPEWVDVLVGGTPCQAFSVAGLRAGLTDPRGALTEAFFKLASIMRPRFIVWENVPGVLSIDGGRVFSGILAYLEEIGYIVDADVLDAQFFGLAQRRQRVFLVCQSIEDIRQSRTASSGLILAQCLTETSRLILAGARGPSPIGRESWEFGSGPPADSVKRRTTLFGLANPDHRAMWRESLVALPPASAREQSGSASTSGTRGREGTHPRRAAMPFVESYLAPPDGSPNTAPSWPNILDAMWPIMSGFTTSTSTSSTTESEIFTCAQASLTIAARIGHSMTSSPRFWSAASSASTAMLEFTSYARAFCSRLFSDRRWVREWDHFLREAMRLHISLGGSGDWSSPPPLLSFAEGVRRDSPPRRQAGAGVAGALGTGASCGGGWRVGADEAAAGHAVPVDLQNTRIGGDVVGALDCSRPGRGGGQAVMRVAPITGTLCNNGKAAGSATQQDAETGFLVAYGGNNPGPLDVATACNAKGGAGRMDFESETFIAHTLRAEGHDASEDGTGRGVPLVPVAYMPARTLAKDGGIDERFAERDVCDALHRSSANGNKAPMLRERRGVRRLLPIEMERLQGFPDHYTLLPDQQRKAVEDDYAAWYAERFPEMTREQIERLSKDGPRAKALGNSMPVPVMRWIGERVLLVDAMRRGE